MITRNTVAAQLRDYLQHRTTRASLVDWAERAMMEEEFDEGDLETIRDIRVGLGSLTFANSASPGKTAKASCRALDTGQRSTSFKRAE
jgi:hypothetical protein